MKRAHRFPRRLIRSIATSSCAATQMKRDRRPRRSYVSCRGCVRSMSGRFHALARLSISLLWPSRSTGGTTFTRRASASWACDLLA